MAMTLTRCSQCERHVRVESTTCPFCKTTLDDTASGLSRTMMTVVAAVGLAVASCGGDDGSTASDSAEDLGGADYAGPGMTINDVTSEVPTEEPPMTAMDSTTGMTSGGSTADDESADQGSTDSSSSGEPGTDSSSTGSSGSSGSSGS